MYEHSREREALARLEEEEECRKRTLRKFIATLNLITKRLRVDDFLYIIKDNGNCKTKMQLPRIKTYYEDQTIDWKNENGFFGKVGSDEGNKVYRSYMFDLL